MTQAAPLDTLIRVETPEAIDIRLAPASLYQRALAFSIDAAIRGIWLFISTMVILSVLAAKFADSNALYVAVGLILVNLFAVTWLYPVLFEVFNRGRTPGKMALGIRVVHDNGSPVGWSASMLRNLLRAFDGLPLLYAVGMAVMLVSNKGQRVGDWFAATVVISDPKRPKSADFAHLNAVAAVLPPIALSREEQYSVVAFAERSRHLPKARQHELAWQLCRDLGLVVHEGQAVQTVLGLGKHYLGQDEGGA